MIVVHETARCDLRYAAVERLYVEIRQIRVHGDVAEARHVDFNEFLIALYDQFLLSFVLAQKVVFQSFQAGYFAFKNGGIVIFAVSRHRDRLYAHDFAVARANGHQIRWAERSGVVYTRNEHF